MKRMRLVLVLFVSLLTVHVVAAHPGIGIVMDSKGNVYYTDLVHVWKISPDGAVSIAVKEVHTHELYLDEEGNLFGEHVWYEGEATDKWGHYIWCLTSTGELTYAKAATEGFPSNNTLVRDARGNTYWAEKTADHEQLNRTSAKGRKLVHTRHRFRDIRWMHIPGNSQDLYVIDYLTLKKVTPNGQVVVVADQLKDDQPPFESVGDHHYLMGIWTDDQQGVYVAVFGGQQVKRIAPDGQVETIFRSESAWSPCGGLVAPDGSLWILEFSADNQTRVRRIALDGEHRVFGN